MLHRFFICRIPLCSSLKRKERFSLRPSFRALLICFCFFVFNAEQVRACGGSNCGCVELWAPITAKKIEAEHEATRKHITDEMEAHRNDYIVGYLFEDHIVPALMHMTEQLSTTAMHQAATIGMFFDAKHQLETQTLLQDLQAQAHKDYHPSTGMCAIGTTARGLAAAKRNGDLVSHVLEKRSQNRQLGSINVASAGGPDIDSLGRVGLFVGTFCNTRDNDNGLGRLCEDGIDTDLLNRDVDYGRSLANPPTIEVDFSNGNSTSDELSIWALSDNLYAHTVFNAIPAEVLKQTNGQRRLLSRRSLVAKRSVAEHSFNRMVGMKAQGSAISANTAPWLYAAFEPLGVPTEEIPELVGARPSYDSHMRILTKKLYQNPSFFVDLYDKPANVDRKSAALRAIGLIQSFDEFKSGLQHEMLLALLLELEVQKEQDRIEGPLGSTRSTQ